MTHWYRSASTLASSLLLACSSASHSAVVDGGDKKDVSTRDAAIEAAMESGQAPFDASSDAGEAGADSTRPSRPPPCTGPSDCAAGEICCADLVAEISAASCTMASTCAAGLVTVCEQIGAACKVGRCLEYQCRVSMPGHTVDVLACGNPSSRGVACGPVGDGGLGEPPDADVSGDDF